MAWKDHCLCFHFSILDGAFDGTGAASLDGGGAPMVGMDGSIVGLAKMTDASFEEGLPTGSPT